MFNKNPIYKIFNKEKIQMASELYGQFMEKNLGGPISYRIDDIFNTNLGEMQGYRQELLKKVKEESDDKIYEAYDKAIELYAIKAYKIANIEWKDEYFYYFQDFKTLRSAANKKEYEKYYLKYKDYIFSNR